MEQCGADYGIEKWYSSYALEVMDQKDQFEDLTEQAIKAFGGDVVAKLAEVQRDIMQFKKQFEESRCKREIALLYFSYHHTPSLNKPSKDTINTAEVDKIKIETETVVRQQMQAEYDDKIAELLITHSTEITNIKQSVKNQSRNYIRSKKAKMQSEYDTMKADFIKRVDEQVQRQKAGVEQEMKNFRVGYNGIIGDIKTRYKKREVKRKGKMQQDVDYMKQQLHLANQKVDHLKKGCE